MYRAYGIWAVSKAEAQFQQGLGTCAKKIYHSWLYMRGWEEHGSVPITEAACCAKLPQTVCIFERR